MIFGGQQNLSPKLRQSLEVIGMQHVTSASGYNVGLVIALTQIIVSRFSRFKQLALLVGMVWFYATLAEFTPSIMRATVMVTIGLVGSRWLGRQYSPATALLATAIGLITISPPYLVSLSFQLSLAATAGMITLLPWWKSSTPTFWLLQLEVGGVTTSPNSAKSASPWRVTQQIWLILEETFLTTLAAQITTLPLILHSFGSLATLSLLTNTVLLWLTPVITTTAIQFWIICALLGWLPGLSVLLKLWASVIWVPTEMFMRLVTWFGQWQTSLLIMPRWNWGQVWLWWIGVAFITYMVFRRTSSPSSRLQFYA